MALTRPRPVVPAEAGTHLTPSPLTGEGWGEGDFLPSFLRRACPREVGGGNPAERGPTHWERGRLARIPARPCRSRLPSPSLEAGQGEGDSSPYTPAPWAPP